MKVQKIDTNAVLPTKAHTGDLGYDLYSSSTATIAPGDTILVRTGIAVEFPKGYGALIRDRSSVATKKCLLVVAGVIDNGYTGEIQVAFHNSGPIEQHFFTGDKIAQMILIPTVDFAVEEVSSIKSADQRGDKGFGSTGQ